MRQFVVVCLLFLTVATAPAQSTNIRKVFQSNFAKAEEMYAHLAYRNALELYLAVIGKDSLNLPARQRIADCYFRIGKLGDAERWYSSLAFQPDGLPEHKYRYAETLLGQGKYKEAQEWFREYAKVSEDSRATSKIEFLQHLDYYFRDSALYSIKNEPYNSDQSDFAPQYYKDGVVIISARDRDMFIKHQSTSALNDKEMMLNIYFAPKTATEEGDAILFDSRYLRSSFHDGPITFFDNSKRAVFSRTNVVNGRPVMHSGKVNLKLYFGELDADNAIERVEAFPFNGDEFSITHPWISEDGNTLFFASNQPNGVGGVDIYTTNRSNGQWETPVNLGSSVNTIGDELYPFLANDSTLYFSSNGYGGIGGLDIYVSRRSGDVWSTPVNPGFPLNTSADDFALIMEKDGRQGMLSSNRPGGVGYDDIYSFTVNSFSIVGRAVDMLETSKPVAGAKVFIADDSSQQTHEIVTDKNGFFYFDAPFDRSFRFWADKAGYTSMDTLTFLPGRHTFGRDSILLKLLPRSLFAKGTIYSNESQKELSNATVVIKNFTDGRIDSVATDNGLYSFELQPGKKYLIGASMPGFIHREFELNTTGILTGSLINDIVLEEEFKEKFVIQFDFEKWNIKPESYSALDNVVRAMTRNKKYNLYIGAHADSQGTHEFNLDLSNKRAQEVVKYIEERGVSHDRITAIGFGEELLLNRCSNGVICLEDDHAKNRRAELKVQ